MPSYTQSSYEQYDVVAGPGPLGPWGLVLCEVVLSASLRTPDLSFLSKEKKFLRTLVRCRTAGFPGSLWKL